MAAHGSAFPVAKLALNNSVPPILMASLRMGLVLVILIPFWRFRIPNKKYFPPLIAFSISMGVLVYVFMNLSLYHSSIISPIIVGSQLAIPFGILASAFMLGENISSKKWVLIFTAFVGIILNIKNISPSSWMLISYQAIVVSLCAHLLMFYLYKFYTVGRIFPFYSLFPIFGIAMTFLIFGEVPTILFVIGGIIVISSVFFLHKIR